MHCTTWHIPKGFLLNFHGHHNFHICVLNFVHLFHLKRKFKKCFLLFSAFSLISLSLSLLPSISIYWAISFLLKVFLYRLVSSDLPEIFFFLFSCSAIVWGVIRVRVPVGSVFCDMCFGVRRVDYLVRKNEKLFEWVVTSGGIRSRYWINSANIIQLSVSWCCALH